MSNNTETCEELPDMSTDLDIVTPIDVLPPIAKAERDDPYTLYVRGGNQDDDDPKKRPTDPRGLSRSMIHVLAQNPDGFVKLKSVGPTAMNIVMHAFRLTSETTERRTNGVVLVARQSEYTAEIAGKRSVGICTRIFSIPIKHAV